MQGRSVARSGRSRWFQLLATFAVLTIVAAACATDEEPVAEPDEPEPAEEPEEEDEPAEAVETDGPTFDDDGVLQPLADGFPEDTLTLIVAHPPGHADELYARTVIEAAEDISPVPLVMRNEPSGPRLNFETLDFMETVPGGTEGYTTVVWALAAAPVRLLTVLGPGDRWDIEDVARGTIGITEEEPVVLAVREDSEFEDLDDLVEFARENPGRLRISTSAIGSLVHLNAELLADDMDFEYTAVPNDGVGEAQGTLLGGGAEAVTTLPAQAAPLIEEGRLRALLQWGDARSTLLPDVPASAELDLRGVGVTRGLVAHPDTPLERIEWLETLLLTAAEQQPYRDRVDEFGQAPLFQGHQEAGQGLIDLLDAIEPIIRDLGLAAD